MIAAIPVSIACLSAPNATSVKIAFRSAKIAKKYAWNATKQTARPAPNAASAISVKYTVRIAAFATTANTSAPIVSFAAFAMSIITVLNVMNALR